MIRMKDIKSLIIVFAFLLLTNADSPQQTFQKVLSLTTQTYSTTLKDNMFAFVQYYSPRCKQYQQFAQEYEQLAKKVEEEKLNYIIAAVDLTTEDAINDEVNILTFPSFIFYINNSAIDYKMERKADTMLQFMKNHTFSRLPIVKSLNGLTPPFVVIEGVKDNSDLHSLPILISSCPIYHYQHAGNNELTIKIFIQSLTSMRSFYKNLNELITWIETTIEPQIIDIAKEKAPKRLEQAIENQNPLLVLVKRDKSGIQAMATFRKFCRGRFSVVCGAVSTSDELYNDFNEWLKDPGYQRSSLVLIDTLKWRNFIFRGNLSTMDENQLQRFVANTIQKNLVKKDVESEANLNEAVKQPKREKKARQSNQERPDNRERQERQKLPRQERPNYPPPPKPNPPLKNEQL